MFDFEVFNKLFKWQFFENQVVKIGEIFIGICYVLGLKTLYSHAVCFLIILNNIDGWKSKNGNLYIEIAPGAYGPKAKKLVCVAKCPKSEIENIPNFGQL